MERNFLLNHVASHNFPEMWPMSVFRTCVTHWARSWNVIVARIDSITISQSPGILNALIRGSFTCVSVTYGTRRRYDAALSINIIYIITITRAPQSWESRGENHDEWSPMSRPGLSPGVWSRVMSRPGQLMHIPKASPGQPDPDANDAANPLHFNPLCGKHF